MPSKPTIRVKFALWEDLYTKTGKKKARPLPPRTGKIDRRSIPPGDYETIDDIRRDQWIDRVTVIEDGTKERYYFPRMCLPIGIDEPNEEITVIRSSRR